MIVEQHKNFASWSQNQQYTKLILSSFRNYFEDVRRTYVLSFPSLLTPLTIFLDLSAEDISARSPTLLSCELLNVWSLVYPPGFRKKSTLSCFNTKRLKHLLKTVPHQRVLPDLQSPCRQSHRDKFLSYLWPRPWQDIIPKHFCHTRWGMQTLSNVQNLSLGTAQINTSRQTMLLASHHLAVHLKLQDFQRRRQNFQVPMMPPNFAISTTRSTFSQKAMPLWIFSILFYFDFAHNQRWSLQEFPANALSPHILYSWKFKSFLRVSMRTLRTSGGSCFGCFRRSLWSTPIPTRSPCRFRQLLLCKRIWKPLRPRGARWPYFNGFKTLH